MSVSMAIEVALSRLLEGATLHLIQALALEEYVMNWTWENKLFTVYAGIKRVEMVEGVNSRLPSGRHWLMWDFDNVEFCHVRGELLRIQRKYRLPKIYILNTGIPCHYHANCFVSLDWLEARSIIASTEYVDYRYIAIGILRGFFTLRYSPARGKEFQPAIILPSRVPEDVDPFALTSFVTYSKKRR